MAKDVDEKILLRESFLEQLAATLPRALLSQPKELEGWLAERHRLNPVFSLGLLVADRKGRVLADFPHFPGRNGAMLTKHPDFIRLIEKGNGGVGVGSPRIGLYTKQPTLPMGISLRDTDGKVEAVLIGITALNTPGFLDRVAKGRIGETGSYLLVSPGDKLFVAAGAPDMVLKPTPAAGINLLHDRAMEGYRGSGVTINAFGVEELSSMVGVPSTGWFVVARMPTREAFAAVRHAQDNVIWNSLLALVFVIFVCSFFVRRMLRPLHDAAALADRMTHGEIPLAPLPVVRDDEVGHLTAAFNQLLDKLATSQEQLNHMAHHDSLTGLPNRAMLADRLEQGARRAGRNKTRLALLYLDLDGFKAINDELGHDAGDAALIEIARRLSGIVRQTDTVARIGGDEFVILATDLSADGVAGIAALAQKCIDVLSASLDLNGASRTIGVSIGVALGAGEIDPESLLAEADTAMYKAKGQGKGCYVLAEAPPASVP